MKVPVGALAPSKCGSTQNMAANIKVVVRVRPLNEKENELNNRVVVDVVDEQMLIFDPKEKSQAFFYQGVQQPNKNFLKRANKELKFVFDHVCDINATNNDVFETTTRDMLSSLMEGYNCSVFAYGATGAGKTFTMIGNSANPGITYLTMDRLFCTINSFEKEREFDIAVSYIEVYNENVYDLLKPSSTPLQLREDNKYGVMVAGLSLHNIKTARELLNMLENGNKNRTQHPTDANAESSRSHAVFQVYVKMRYKTSGQIRVVKLSMIDLAGSERASATGCKGDRFKEGANINRSLLSLGNCINRLADGSNYIPYRDSKLTRLLKDSLGGNCKTVMIANVSPSNISYEDTYNTLKYATRASKIQLSIKKNIVDGDMRISEYVKINEELKKKIKELEAKLTLSSIKQAVKKMDHTQEKEQEWRSRVASEEAALASAQARVLKLLTRARVLALRRRLRARAFAHVAQLAHRSSTESVDQMCTEDIPREERAAANYSRQAVQLDSQVEAARVEWELARARLQRACENARAERPTLSDFITSVEQRIELRRSAAENDLKRKLLAVQHEEINMFTEYMSDMPAMLRKLYLTLKGYDRAPPALTQEYLDIVRKAKSAKGITWSESEASSRFHLGELDLDGQTTSAGYGFAAIKSDATEDATDCDDSTDAENRNPVGLPAKKRKGTPIKLANDETIIINDSLDTLDSARNSSKKIKRKDAASDVENYLDPADLNSTFVLAGKVDSFKKPALKTEKADGMPLPVRRELFDRTNIVHRDNGTGNFGEKGRVVKPVVGRALPVRRPAAGRGAGFGSSLSRDGTPFQRNVQESCRNKANVTQKSVGFKAVRARERVQNHPYSRPTPLARK